MSLSLGFVTPLDYMSCSNLILLAERLADEYQMEPITKKYDDELKFEFGSADLSITYKGGLVFVRLGYELDGQPRKEKVLSASNFDVAIRLMSRFVQKDQGGNTFDRHLVSEWLWQHSEYMKIKRDNNLEDVLLALKKVVSFSPDDCKQENIIGDYNFQFWLKKPWQISFGKYKNKAGFFESLYYIDVPSEVVEAGLNKELMIALGVTEYLNEGLIESVRPSRLTMVKEIEEVKDWF